MSNSVPKHLLAEAKKMYLSYMPTSQISEETGIKARTIRYYVDNYWSKERLAEKEKLLEFVSENKRYQLTNIMDRALVVMSKALEELAAKPRITVQEARMTSEILEKIDRIMKLDEGKATSISTNAPPSTVIELKKRLKVDPFIQIEETHETSNDSDSDTTTYAPGTREQ